jgi:putative ABC transport system substrate-binding protein
MAFGPARDEYARLAARYIDRMSKGAKPGELSIEQPTRFHLVINLKSGQSARPDDPAEHAAERGRED